MPLTRRNPCELEIDLFCSGARLDPSCTLEGDARRVARTRAGLGSGLEIVIPGPLKDIWMNVPVEEDFASDSPYTVGRDDRGYYVKDTRSGYAYPVRIPEEPEWYGRRTARGTEMAKVGVLQGTYLGIYIANSCLFWYSDPPMNCRFCTTGSNVGVNEVAQKDLADVVEVARAAKSESGVTFVHLNSGHQAGRDLALAEPYVRALKEEVGVLVGVQLMPSKDLSQYDRLVELGVDHFSFCYEFQNPDYFARYLPGKERWFGQKAFFDSMEHCARLLGKGAVSGEIIAGVEPIEDTMRAIDYITGIGAFPTVCIFRPVIGAEMERQAPPRYDEMRAVFAHVYEACRKNRIPIGAAPNIEVSLVVQPDDTRYLANSGAATWAYETFLKAARVAARPIFGRKMRAMSREAKTAAASSATSRSANGGPAVHAAGSQVEAANGAASEPPSAAPHTAAAPNAAAAPLSVEAAEAALDAVFARLRRTAERSPDRFTFEERKGILELAPGAAGRDRCRMKVFRPREGKERLCAFFYKRSNLAWSQDRYSYGAVEFLPGQVSDEDMGAWLEWLAGGFDPDRRPARLKKAFLYSIPE
ncbi:MAG: radical SAM protein [Bacteroidota bacterium]